VGPERIFVLEMKVFVRRDEREERGGEDWESWEELGARSVPRIL